MREMSKYSWVYFSFCIFRFCYFVYLNKLIVLIPFLLGIKAFSSPLSAPHHLLFLAGSINNNELTLLIMIRRQEGFF